MLRRVMVAAVFVVPIARAHAQTPAPTADDAAKLTDDSDDDEDNDDGDKSDDQDSDADARAQAEHSDDDLDEHEREAGEQARDVEHEADDEDEGHSHHEPGLGLEWIASRARLRLGLIVQPLARYGPDSIPSPDTLDLAIRRARVAFDAELSHGTGFRVGLGARGRGGGGAGRGGRGARGGRGGGRAGGRRAPGGRE